MTKDEQRSRAEAFLALHAAPPMLVLPNAWDVISARIFETEGFSAVATTSAGVAAVLGYPDGQRMSLEENLDMVRRIADHISVPLSADLEAGYADTAEGVAAAARNTLRAGAVGINLEDGTGDASRPLCDPSEHVEKIVAVRELARAEGIPLVINARTDGYLIANDEPSVCFRQTLARANAYRQAGADCIFVPDAGSLDRDTIRSLVREIDAPLNVIAGAHLPPLAELEAIGVARVTFGPRPMRAALALVRRIARELRTAGTYSAMTADSLSYAEVNRMLAPRRTPEGHVLDVP